MVHSFTRRQTIGALGVAAAGIPSLGEAARARDLPAEPSRPKWLTLPPTPLLPDTPRQGIAAVNGVEIFYAQFGHGPPVLLLHGGLANSNYWGHQVEHLGQNFSVTVMDTRGHGRSPVTSRAFGYRAFADDAAALLDFLKIREAAIVGWSDGGVTGLQLAMMRPDRVSKLFAFGANASGNGLKPGGAQSAVFAAYASRCRSEYQKLSQHPERWPQLVDGLRLMWRTEPNFSAKDLAGVKVVTVIADGEYDEIIRRDHTEAMAREIPRARLVVMPKVSHFAMLQDPEQFNRALSAFLAA